MTNRPQHVANAVDGFKLVAPSQTGELVCDACSKQVEDGEQITVYTTTIDYTDKPKRQEQPYLCRAYCNDCDRHKVKVPLRHAEELMIAGDMVREDGIPTFEDTICIDYSQRGQGIDWNPSRVFAEFTGVNLMENIELDETDNFGPEDIVDLLMIGGVDICDHLDHDGSITTPKSERVEMQQDVFETLVEALG